jgi:hypothetical protein
MTLPLCDMILLLIAQFQIWLLIYNASWEVIWIILNKLKQSYI